MESISVKIPCDVPVMFVVVFRRSNRRGSGSESGPGAQRSGLVPVCRQVGGQHNSVLHCNCPFPFHWHSTGELLSQPSLPCFLQITSRRAFRLSWPFGILRGGGVCWPRGIFLFRFCAFRLLENGKVRTSPSRVAAVSLPTLSSSFSSRRIPGRWLLPWCRRLLLPVLVPLPASLCIGLLGRSTLPFRRFKSSPPGWYAAWSPSSIGGTQVKFPGCSCPCPLLLLLFAPISPPPPYPPSRSGGR